MVFTTIYSLARTKHCGTYFMLMNKPNVKNSFFTRLLNPSSGGIIGRAAWRWCRVGKYEENSGIITAHNGLFSSYSINASEIQSWTVYPEMGFDIVRIELLGNEGVTWIDKYNDLLPILRR